MLRPFSSAFLSNFFAVLSCCFLLLSCGHSGGAEAMEEKMQKAADYFSDTLALFMPDGYTVGFESDPARKGKQFAAGRFVFNLPGGEKADVPPVPFLLTLDGKTLILGTDTVLHRGDFAKAPVAGFKTAPEAVARAPMVLISDDGRVIAARRVAKVGLDYAALNRKKISLKDVPVMGDVSAPVAVVEYSDFQCPYCARASVFIESLLGRYAGKIRVVYKHLPLSFHDWAYDAAAASHCFYRQGGNRAFQIFHDTVFAEQKSINSDNHSERFSALALQAGLDPQKVAACMKSQDTKKRIDEDKAEARALKVDGTPTFFVDGIRVPNEPELLQKAVDIRLSSGK